MTPTAALPLVLHVLPVDLARGPQRYARLVREALDGESARHRTLTLFDSAARVLDADFKLGARQTPLARAGFDPFAAKRLHALLKQLEPAQVIAYGSQPFKYLSAALPLRTRVIYRKIGVAHAPAHRASRKLFHRLLMKRADLVAGVSQECLDEAEHLFGVAPDRLRLVPNGRDPSVFFPGPEREASVCRLTFIGHLTASKRPERFIELVRELRAGGLPVEGRMVGDGPDEARLANQADGSGVRLLGRRDDVPALLRESDIVVITGRPDGEGMPGVLIEASLSGVPCVTTDVPGARSAVIHGETGFVVPPDDDVALATRVRELVESRLLRAQMGAAARRHSLERFTIAQSLNAWRAVLDEAADVTGFRR